MLPLRRSQNLMYGASGTPYMKPQSLTQNSGVITAVMNGSSFTVTPTGLVAHTLYYLYMTSAGLVTSLNPPSQGPGASGWLLVGAFYTNNLAVVSIGAFISISDRPSSDWWFVNNTIPTALYCPGGTNPSYGTEGSNIYRLRRDGENLVGEWNFRQTSAGNAGNGNYMLRALFPIHETYYRPNTVVTYGAAIGSIFTHVANGAGSRGVGSITLFANNLTEFGVTLGNDPQDWSNAPTNSNFAQANLRFNIAYTYKVQGWTNTPLCDL